jgi:hypothetical protein
MTSRLTRRSASGQVIRQAAAAGTRILITQFDRQLFVRSLLAGVLTAAVALAVMLSTDGAGSDPSTRVARLAAMSPIFGAIGSSFAIAHAKARGEQLALTAVGCPPWRVHAAALLAAFAFGWAGAACLASAATDVTALFPSVSRAGWVQMPDGSWLAVAQGLRVGPGLNELALTAAWPAQPTGAASRPSVVSAVAFGAIAFPVWLRTHLGWAERICVGAAVIAALLTTFHYVAAGRCVGWVLLAGPGALLLHVMVRRRPRAV